LFQDKYIRKYFILRGGTSVENELILDDILKMKPHEIKVFK